MTSDTALISTRGDALGCRLTSSVVCHIILVSQVVHSVDRDCSVECVMYRIVPSVRVLHGADHVEMDWISPQPENLAGSSYFNILDSACQTLVAVRVHENLDLHATTSQQYE